MSDVWNDNNVFFDGPPSPGRGISQPAFRGCSLHRHSGDRIGVCNGDPYSKKTLVGHVRMADRSRDGVSRRTFSRPIWIMALQDCTHQAISVLITLTQYAGLHRCGVSDEGEPKTELHRWTTSDHLCSLDIFSRQISPKRVIIEKKSLTGFPKLDKTAGFHGQQGPLGGAQRFTQFILLSTDRSLKCRQQLR
jgi:hypothetical protein